MNHPEILLLPAFMLADYYLTIWSKKLKDRKYEEFFRPRHFELNPQFQKAVAEARLVCPRHLLLVVLFTAYLAFMTEIVELPAALADGLVTFFLVYLGVVLGRHITNILLFRRVIRQHDDISGAVNVSHAFSLQLSLYQILGLLFPVVLLTLLAPSPQLIGGLPGDWGPDHKPSRLDQEAQETD